MRQGDQFQTSFFFKKKALYEVKANGLEFSFDTPQLGKQLKQNI